MVNWSQMRDIYGSADKIPELLRAAASETNWDAQVWDDLWSRLCHQGSVTPASYAAVPELSDIAKARLEVATDPALFLTAAILASTDGPLDRETARTKYAGQVEALRPVALHKLGMTTDPTGFIWALQNVAIFEGFGVWQQELEGLANQEVEADCPACGDHVYLELADAIAIASLHPDDSDGGTRLEPATRFDLMVPEPILYDLAGSYGHQELQRQLLQIFGHFICPACSKRVRIAEALA